MDYTTKGFKISDNLLKSLLKKARTLSSQLCKALLSFQTEIQLYDVFSVPHFHCSEVKCKSFLKSFWQSESYEGQRTFHLAVSGSLLAFVSHPYRKPTHSPTITC